jgi:hypothetical protein
MKAQKVHVVTRITIAAKPGEVFIYLTDLRYYYLWNPHIESISPIKPLTLGMNYQTGIMLMGVRVKSTHEVTKIVVPKLLELQNKAGLVKHRTSFRLTAKGEKTQLICSTVVWADTASFAFAKPVLKLLAQRELKTDMQALKLAVEQKLREV